MDGSAPLTKSATLKPLRDPAVTSASRLSSDNEGEFRYRRRAERSAANTVLGESSGQSIFPEKWTPVFRLENATRQES